MMRESGLVETFTVRGEAFRRRFSPTSGYDPENFPSYWLVWHEDPETGSEHGLGGRPATRENTAALAATHAALLVETGNCQGVIHLQLHAGGATHRGRLNSTLTSCGIRLPATVDNFRIPGPIKAHDLRIFSCGRCRNVNTWR